MQKKNILIISTFFPPDRHIAVSRTVAYAQYLSESHNITVLTLGKESKQEKIFFENGSCCTVFYIENNFIFSNLLFYTGRENWFLHNIKTTVRVAFNKLNLSHYLGWSKKSSIFLSDYINKNPIDFLLSSYAPEDVLSISYKSIVNNHSIKWILDMRDEYSDEQGLSRSQRNRRIKKELLFSKRADLILSVSEPLLGLFKDRMLYSQFKTKVLCLGQTS